MSVTRDEKLDGYYGRKHDTMFKVSALLSVSEGSDLLISEEHIYEALNLMASNENNLMSILDSVTSTKIGGVIERVHSMIKRSGPINHAELLRKCWRLADSQEMSIIIRTLLDCGEIEEIADGRGRKYKITRRASTT